MYGGEREREAIDPIDELAVRRMTFDDFSNLCNFIILTLSLCLSLCRPSSSSVWLRSIKLYVTFCFLASSIIISDTIFVGISHDIR